jgi:DNA-binding NarL/FixJ family response regulator
VVIKDFTLYLLSSLSLLNQNNLTPMKTVAIIEDQTAIRDMLSQAVIDKEAYDVIIECGDGQIGCDTCLEQKPDFVILDVMLPNLNGTEILRIFREKIPETQVLIFSGYQSPSLVRELLQAGAHGFVEKSAPLSELRKGIEIVANGGSYFGPEVAQLLREAMADPKSKETGINILTKREREILQLIAESHSTREIAIKLDISVKTAENHRTNLMRKLDLHDVASLTRYAISNGLISISK